MLSKQGILTVLVSTNTVIFFLLAILHFYWAFGGKLWYDDVLPTSSNGLNKLNTSTTAALIVAFGLLLFSMITAGNKGLLNRYIPGKYFSFGTLVISIIFFLRAIGDFKFFGFFKKVKWTKFGENDTQIFSPLCLLIALFSLIIFIFNQNKKSER